MARRRGSKKTRALRKAWRKTIKALAVRCRCGKVVSADRHEAQSKHFVMWAQKGRWQEVRYYECLFGSWH